MPGLKKSEHIGKRRILQSDILLTPAREHDSDENHYLLNSTACAQICDMRLKAMNFIAFGDHRTSEQTPIEPNVQGVYVGRLGQRRATNRV
jgi:hypothetical protein